jgi:molybdopterin-guanine dinucleotide biosynthesis protein MobB
MIPAIAIVGRSNVGKTTVLEGLIPELKRRGYRVAAAKHIYEDVEFDTPGKDTWRLSRSGADAVIMSLPSRLVLSRVEDDASVEDIRRIVGVDFDILLVEGHKKSGVPKIEVRRGDKQEPVARPEETIAVVSDRGCKDNVPVFTFEDSAGLADLVEKRFLAAPAEIVSLHVNRRPVRLNPFVSGFISRTLTGMVSSLKGVTSGIREISIGIKMPE